VTDSPKPARAPSARVLELAHQVLHPEPLGIYRPMGVGRGKAMKVSARWADVTRPKGTYVTEVDGGCFLEIAPEAGVADNGKNARFGWGTPEAITVLLGLADIQHWLVAIREYRLRRKLPASLCKGKGKGVDRKVEDGVIEFYHKTPAGQTIITVTFAEDSATIRLYRGRGGNTQDAQSIKIGLAEEYALERYLDLALNRILALGVR
jgi:hypothetical protein